MEVSWTTVTDPYGDTIVITGYSISFGQHNVSVLPDVTGVSFYVNKNYVGQVLSIYSETDELPSEIV